MYREDMVGVNVSRRFNEFIFLVVLITPVSLR